jgi:hypothetical protein
MAQCRRWRFRRRVTLLVCTDGVVRVRWGRLALTLSPRCLIAVLFGTLGLLWATGTLPFFVELAHRDYELTKATRAYVRDCEMRLGGRVVRYEEVHGDRVERRMDCVDMTRMPRE